MLLLPAGNASEWTSATGNNTWLATGPPAVLIDAGVGSSDHVASIERVLDPRPLDAVLITHGHIDHVSGVSALRRRWHELTVRGGGAGEPFSDNEELRFGGLVLRAIFTPGHSPDHYCFFDEGTGDLYCGDLARAGGTVVIPASRGGDLAHYLSSLRRIRELQPARLLPAHGPIVSHPITLIDEYLAHREARTRQVRKLLSEGITDVDSFVTLVYPGLSPSLREAARETIRAHLAFIQQQDR